MSDQEQPLYSNYRMRQGVMRIPREVDSRKVFATSRDFIAQGELIPTCVLEGMDVESLVAEGIIEEAGAGGAAQAINQQAAMSPGKWAVDPGALLDDDGDPLDMEALLERVLAIDPEFDVDTLETPEQAIAQLTADWNQGAFAEPVAESRDRTSPGLPAMSDRTSEDGAVESARRAAGSADAEQG